MNVFFFILCNNRGTNFAETRFIFKSSLNIRWYEIQDKPFISEISSMVWWWSALIALQNFQDFHHFGRLKVGQILPGPHMTFHPLPDVNTTRTLESYLKLLAALKRFQKLISQQKIKLHAHSLFFIISHHKNRRTSWQLLKRKHATTSSSRTTFKFLLFLGPLSYAIKSLHFLWSWHFTQSDNYVMRLRL